MGEELQVWMPRPRRTRRDSSVGTFTLEGFVGIMEWLCRKGKRAIVIFGA